MLFCLPRLLAVPLSRTPLSMTWSFPILSPCFSLNAMPSKSHSLQKPIILFHTNGHLSFMELVEICIFHWVALEREREFDFMHHCVLGTYIVSCLERVPLHITEWACIPDAVGKGGVATMIWGLNRTMIWTCLNLWARQFIGQGSKGCSVLPRQQRFVLEWHSESFTQGSRKDTMGDSVGLLILWHEFPD